MKIDSRVEQVAAMAAIVLLVIGCFWVLKPFVSALLWAAIVCYSTWPLYSRLESFLKGRRTLAATLMTFLIALGLVAPFVFVGLSLRDNILHIVGVIRGILNEGLPDLPPWVARLPLVGDWIQAYWQDMAHSSDKLMVVIKDLMVRSRSWLVDRGVYLGQTVAQLTLSIFIAFFFYRDGVMVVEKIKHATRRIAGDRTQHLLDMIGGTVKGVVYGILGTALAQGTLAGIGLWIAGVPLALLLGLTTFFLSLIPIGPPLVWVPATIWLFSKGSMAWGIFMGLWGMMVVSGVDNVLKPYIISRGSNLPFILVFLGILGGLIAFGFIGVFLGPLLLAVGFNLVQEWSSKRKEDHA